MPSNNYESVYVLDQNECLVQDHGCEHSCVNNAGSFTCSCRTGYTLDDNGKNCTGKFFFQFHIYIYTSAALTPYHTMAYEEVCLVSKLPQFVHLILKNLFFTLLDI